jgi:hypothetical protein
LKTLNPIASKPTIDLKNVQDVFIYNAFVDKPTPVYLHVSGNKTKNVVLKNNNFLHAEKAVVREDDVAETIVVQ